MHRARTTTRDGLCRVGQSGAGCTANSALERQNDTNDNLRKMEGHYRIFFVTLCSMLNVRLLEPARRLEPRKPTGTSGLSLCAADQRRCRAADGIHVGHRNRHRKVETPPYTYSSTQDRKSTVDFAMSSTCLHLLPHLRRSELHWQWRSRAVSSRAGGVVVRGRTRSSVQLRFEPIGCEIGTAQTAT